MKAVNKLIDAIASWIFKPTPKPTYTCCSDADEDEEEHQ